MSFQPRVAPGRALHGVGRKQRAPLHGRVVVLLTANRRYALDGVHVGARFARVARFLISVWPFV